MTTAKTTAQDTATILAVVAALSAAKVRKARTAGLTESIDRAAHLSSDSGLIPVNRNRWAR